MGWAQDLKAVLAAAPREFHGILKALDPVLIEEVLEATSTATSRKRRLPGMHVIFLVLGMSIYRDKSIKDVVAILDLALPSSSGASVAASAITQARARLGPRPIKFLFERTARSWSRTVSGEYMWKGLRLYAMDGTTFRVDDTLENRTHFGGTTGKSASSRPLARAVVLLAPGSRLVVNACIGPYARGEQTLASDLWQEVPENSVVLIDRAFNNVAKLIPLASTGNRHWLLRAKSTSSWKVIKELGPDDFLVEFRVSSGARKASPELPLTFVARVIGYQRAGYKKGYLITSMLDPVKYPAADIAVLYHSRWEIENAYDEVKTEVLNREEALRSKRPDGVMQEIWGLLLAYNLVRLEMARIADEAGVAPYRISFVTALSFVRAEWVFYAAAPPGVISDHLIRLREEISRFVLPPRRSERSYPRVVKSRGLKYPRKPARARATPLKTARSA